MADLLYFADDHELLTQKALGLGVQLESYGLLAEMLLGFQTPVYTGDDAEKLAIAVALQVNFMVDQGIEPKVVRSVSNTHPGNTTTYRNRYISPEAAKVVQEVTKVAYVGFAAPFRGV